MAEETNNTNSSSTPTPAPEAVTLKNIKSIFNKVVTVVGVCLLFPIVPGIGNNLANAIGMPEPDIPKVVNTAMSAYTAQVNSLKDNYNDKMLEAKLLQANPKKDLTYNSNVFSEKFGIVKGNIPENVYNSIKTTADEKFSRLANKYKILLAARANGTLTDIVPKKADSSLDSKSKTFVLDSSNIDKVANQQSDNAPKTGSQEQIDAKATNNILSPSNKSIYLTDKDVTSAFDWTQTTPWKTISIVAGAIILIVEGVMLLVRICKED